MAKFSTWLNDKYRQWEKESGRHQTITSFARHLGVKQPSLTRWMNDDNPPDLSNIRKIAEKLGPEVYDIFGMERPIPPAYLNQLPNDFRLRLEQAIDEVNVELARQNIPGDSPQGETLTIQIFAKHGFKYTSTEDKPD